MLPTRFGLIQVLKSLHGATLSIPQGEEKTEGLELLLIPTPSFIPPSQDGGFCNRGKSKGQKTPIFTALRQNTEHLLDGYSEQEEFMYWRHRHQGTAQTNPKGNCT